MTGFAMAGWLRRGGALRRKGCKNVSNPQTEPIRFRTIVLLHAGASLFIQSVWFAVSTMMPVLARKRFAAGDWETLLITASVPTLLVMSIFWNAILQRLTLRRYLIAHGFSVCVPLVLAALATRFEHLLAAYALAAIGISGWSPASGEVLKRLYGSGIRGRAFAMVNTGVFLGMTAFSYGIGLALDFDENSFRVYLPAGAGLYAAGIFFLRRLVALQSAATGQIYEMAPAAPLRLVSLLRPVLHLRSVLAADRTFYAYEAAFMTYGIGWMICNALLPVFATDRLHMTYGEFATSSQTVYAIGLLVLTLPMGWLMDQIGPAKTSAVSFACLGLYPVALLCSTEAHHVAWASLLYGGAMAGVNLTWMLGPVSLAPTPEKVAHYVAIHTTLVGLRGVVAQGLGMFLYRATGSFACPLLIASVAFLWAAWRMRALGLVRLGRDVAAKT